MKIKKKWGKMCRGYKGVTKTAKREKRERERGRVEVMVCCYATDEGGRAKKICTPREQPNLIALLCINGKSYLAR